MPAPLLLVPVAASLMVGWFADRPYCYVNECCREPWVSLNNTHLDLMLNRHLCGQLPAKNMITRALHHHWSDKKPKKPLVMSFHGSPGVGKTHAIQLIRDSLFSEGEKTQYFEFIAVPHEFPHQSDEEFLQEYRKKLHERIRKAVERCDSALVVLEEAHLMGVKLLESIRPFLDTNEKVDGVDFRRATFILVSNTAFKGLVDLAYNYYEKGLSAHQIPVVEIEKTLDDLAYNDDSADNAFYKSLLLARHLIDFYIPFFPLTRDHIRCCIRDEWKRRFEHVPNDKQIENILKSVTFYPDHNPIFADWGCKPVSRAIALSDLNQEEM